MYFIYKLLFLGFIIIFREYIYICFVTVKRNSKKRKIKKHKPYPNRPTRGPTPNPSARALAPPYGRRLMLPLPQPPPTLSSSLSLHAPNAPPAPPSTTPSTTPGAAEAPTAPRPWSRLGAPATSPTARCRTTPSRRSSTMPRDPIPLLVHRPGLLDNQCDAWLTVLVDGALI
jgi:hypothetical protein